MKLVPASMTAIKQSIENVSDKAVAYFGFFSISLRIVSLALF
jgi:hypothetical protein